MDDVSPLTPEQLCEVERIAKSRPADELSGEDDWCCGTCEDVSDFLVSEGVPHEMLAGDLDCVGATFDSSHCWIEVNGWVIDPTITQFLGPKASEDQRKVVKGFPNHQSAPTVAVIPPDHHMRVNYYHPF